MVSGWQCHGARSRNDAAITLLPAPGEETSFNFGDTKGRLGSRRHELVMIVWAAGPENTTEGGHRAFGRLVNSCESWELCWAGQFEKQNLSFCSDSHIIKLRSDGGLFNPSLVFRRWSAAPSVLHKSLDISSAHSMKILAPGRLRSGHQVRSSGPTSKKVCDRVTVTVIERMFRNFQDMTYSTVLTSCIAHIFLHR